MQNIEIAVQKHEVGVANIEVAIAKKFEVATARH